MFHTMRINCILSVSHYQHAANLFRWSFDLCCMQRSHTVVGPVLCPAVSLSLQESQFFHHYELCLSGPPLGEGSFSVCRKCRHKQNGRDYAVKIVSRRWACTSAVIVWGCVGVCHSMSLPRWVSSLLGWRQTRRGRLLHWDIANPTQILSSCTKFTLIRYSRSRGRFYYHRN